MPDHAATRDSLASQPLAAGRTTPPPVPVSDGGLVDLVDLERYPVADPCAAGYRDIVARVRGDLTTVGCSVLPDFVPPERQAALRSECASVADRAYHDVETVNAYNTPVDPSLPAGHPARVTMERGNAFVSRPDIPDALVVHRLYTSPRFQRFIADCFALPRLHELADPLAGLCLNVIPPGRSHPWHFDTNEFTVSMLTQQPEAGGVFEYCPNIRSPRDENFDRVGEVLAGRGGGIRRLALRPGDLQLFTGRFSLHRVTPVTCGSARHSAIFAYSERPGVVGTLARTRQLFGDVSAVHLAAAERAAVRGDRLLD